MESNKFIDDLGFDNLGKNVTPDNKVIEEKKQLIERLAVPNASYITYDLTQNNFGPWRFGFDNYLPNNEELNAESFANLIHPDFRRRFELIARSMFMATLEITGNKLNFWDQRRIIYIPLKSTSGSYYWVRTSSYPWRLNQAGVFTEVIFHIETLEKYKNQVLYFDIYGYELELKERILKRVWEIFLGLYHIQFTDTEKKILRIYNSDSLPNANGIAKRLNIRVSTVHTHNKHILKKASEIVGISFINAVEVSFFFKKYKLFLPDIPN